VDLSRRPWLDSYSPGVPADIDTPSEPVTAALYRSASAHPSRVALDFMGSVTTYDTLARRVNRAAEALRELGVRRGDRVAIILPNCPTHVVAFYAVLRLGAVVVEHNPTYTADELEHQLRDSGAVVAIVWEKATAAVLAVRERTGLHGVVVVDLTRDLPGIKRAALRLPVPSAREVRRAMRSRVSRDAGVLRWDRLVRRTRPLPADHPQPSVDDIAALQYTGGTTGTPRGAVLRHRHLVANAAQGHAWTQHHEATETVYAALPFFHAFGLTLCLTYAIRIAATVVIFPRFDVEMVLAAQRRRPATFIPGVPPMFERLAVAARRTGTDMTSVTHSISGAMSLPAATAQAWEEVTGGLLVEGYGLTETSPVALGNPMSAARRPGMLGVPFPSTHIRVVDGDTDRDVAPGERGELLISGPQVFDGYWERPDETAHVLTERDGRTWLRTGDIVVMSDGFVRLVDRIKEVIVTGGFKVYPSQVEDQLRSMPEISDVAVVGIPGGDLGEKVVAAIVLAEGVTKVEMSAVRAWSEQRLARYAQPRDLVILTELPRSQIGKVLRRVVRQEIVNRG
jgi:long-chain acyl-CoA synthetase